MERLSQQAAERGTPAWHADRLAWWRGQLEAARSGEISSAEVRVEVLAICERKVAEHERALRGAA